MKRLALVAIIVGALGAPVAFSQGSGSAVSREDRGRTAHTVRVFTGTDAASDFFATGRCGKTKAGTFSMKSTSALNGKGRLLATVLEFDGYHHYPVTLGQDTLAYVTYVDPSGKRFSSLNAPPYPLTSVGGIDFDKDNKGILMGVAFNPAFEKSGKSAVGFTGVLRCRFHAK